MDSIKLHQTAIDKLTKLTTNFNTNHFWKSKPITSPILFSDQTANYTSELYKYSKKKNKFEAYNFRLHGHKFGYIKGDTYHYRELGNEILYQPSKSKYSKYPFELRFVYGYKTKIFYSKNFITLTLWYHEIKKLTILYGFHDEFEVVSKVHDYDGEEEVIKAKMRSCPTTYYVKCFRFDDLLVNALLKEKVFSEINFIKDFTSPFLHKYISTYVDNHNIYIIYEDIIKQTLEQKLHEAKQLSELDSSEIMRNMLESLSYLHENKHIIHRNITPKAILLNKISYDAFSKLSRFELACSINEEQKETYCGSYYYRADNIPYLPPETRKNGKYNTKGDIYSLGIIFYKMLTGSLPPIIENKLDYSNFKGSLEALELLKNMTNIEEDKRYTADKALKSSWIDKYFPYFYNSGFGSMDENNNNDDLRSDVDTEGSFTISFETLTLKNLKTSPRLQKNFMDSDIDDVD